MSDLFVETKHETNVLNVVEMNGASPEIVLDLSCLYSESPSSCQLER